MKYEVNENDTLSAVASAHRMSAYELLLANPSLRRARTLSGAPCFHEDVWAAGLVLDVPDQARTLGGYGGNCKQVCDSGKPPLCSWFCHPTVSVSAHQAQARQSVDKQASYTVPDTGEATCPATSSYSDGKCVSAAGETSPTCTRRGTVWSPEQNHCVSAPSSSASLAPRQATVTNDATNAGSNDAPKSSTGPIVAGLAIAAVSVALVYGALHAK